MKNKYKLILVATVAIIASAFTVDHLSEKEIFMRQQTLTRKNSFIADKMPVYEIDTNTNSDITYIRYKSGDDFVFIAKYNESGLTTIHEKAYDTWANRETATYIPYNSQP